MMFGFGNKKSGWLSRLTAGLSKSSEKISSGIGDLLTKRKLDRETLDELEEVLIGADLGPTMAARVMEGFAKDRFGKDATGEEIREALAEVMTEILAPAAKSLVIERPATGPFVILVCGVNGAGKTTTIGKMAAQFTAEGKKVMLAAGDTFRAAAVEQLKIWAERTGATFSAKGAGADAAALAYESYVLAVKEGIDILMIDTAGRLHNKSNLMEELQKIVRVLKKHDETLPHATILVLDATTGQNAHAQVEIFKEMVNVTGLVVTKLDGSARGGVVVGLAGKFGLPVHLIGVGEGVEDLQPFRAQDFARSLVGVG